MGWGFYCHAMYYFFVQIIKAQITFVSVYLADVFHAIKVLQKESGGILDIMGLLNKLKGQWQELCEGKFQQHVQKALNKLPAADAKGQSSVFQACGKALVKKVDNLLQKTVKAKSIKVAQSIASLCPSVLQSVQMVPTATIKEAIPLVDIPEWEKYMTLPPQQPAPTTTSGRVEWWRSRVTDFPNLAPVAIAYLKTPRSAAQPEHTFSLLGHNQGFYLPPPSGQLVPTSAIDLQFC